MGSGEPGEEALERRRRRGEEGARNADRRSDPDTVAVAGDVLDGDPAIGSSDPGGDGSTRSDQLGQPDVAGGRAAFCSGRDLVG
jgi:hypothetical protein